MVSTQAHWGEYLPDWHPWEDYRQSYSARQDLGGGVVLTLCHPLDYLRWLIGEVDEVQASVGYTGLDIEAEDTADIQLRFTNGVMGQVHLDYVQRPSSHWLQIIGTEGTIRWDNADGIAHWYRADTKEWKASTLPEEFERNTMFMDEANHFLDCVRNEMQPGCTLADGIAVLRIALAAKRNGSQLRIRL